MRPHTYAPNPVTTLISYWNLVWKLTPAAGYVARGQVAKVAFLYQNTLVQVPPNTKSSTMDNENIYTPAHLCYASSLWVDLTRSFEAGTSEAREKLMETRYNIERAWEEWLQRQRQGVKARIGSEEAIYLTPAEDSLRVGYLNVFFNKSKPVQERAHAEVQVSNLRRRAAERKAVYLKMGWEMNYQPHQDTTYYGSIQQFFNQDNNHYLNMKYEEE